MAVRHPGHYGGWLHVIANLPSSSNMIDLYQWLSDWTATNYGYRWTGSGKKLNAILTVTSGTILSARHRGNIDGFPATVNEDAAIYIKPNESFGGNSFRDFDRITIINNGAIIGAYGTHSYCGTGTFTPPAAVNFGSSGINRYKAVTSVELHSYGGGGDGGNQIGGGGGSGGGGGGSGGYGNYRGSVVAGTQISASGSGRGTYSYSQGGTLSRGDAGGNGANARNAGRCRDCKCSPITFAIGWAFGTKWLCKRCNEWSGVGGDGGARGDGSPRGRDGVAGTQGRGSKGCEGGTSDFVISWGGHGCCGACTGGEGGVGGDGHTSAVNRTAVSRGGNGQSACNTGTKSNGENGTNEFTYSRDEMFGPAIITHRAVFIDNDNGFICGGYERTSGQLSVCNKAGLNSSTKFSIHGINHILQADKSNGTKSNTLNSQAGTRVFNSLFTNT